MLVTPSSSLNRSLEPPHPQHHHHLPHFKTVACVVAEPVR